MRLDTIVVQAVLVLERKHEWKWLSLFYNVKEKRERISLLLLLLLLLKLLSLRRPVGIGRCSANQPSSGCGVSAGATAAVGTRPIATSSCVGSKCV